MKLCEAKSENVNMGIHIILFAGWFNYMAKSKWFKWIAQLEIHSCWVFQGFRLQGKLEKSSEWFSPWNEVKRWPKKIWASLLALNGRLGLQHCLAIFSAAAVSYRTCSRGNPWAKNVHFGSDLYAIIWMYRHPPHLLSLIQSARSWLKRFLCCMFYMRQLLLKR